MSGQTYFVHLSSCVDSDVEIGEGTKIWHFCHIQRGARIGKLCSLGQNVNVSNHVKVGDGCKIQNNVSLYEGVELENDVFCGPSCVFTNDLTPRAKYPKGSAGYHKTLVKEGASIGAGAVVASDVPDHALMLGVPAKQAGWVCECGQKLCPDGMAQFRCPDCERNYRLRNGSQIEEIK